jgi:hypothetical protein
LWEKGYYLSGNGYNWSYLRCGYPQHNLGRGEFSDPGKKALQEGVKKGFFYARIQGRDDGFRLDLHFLSGGGEIALGYEELSPTL